MKRIESTIAILCLLLLSPVDSNAAPDNCEALLVPNWVQIKNDKLLKASLLTVIDEERWDEFREDESFGGSYAGFGIEGSGAETNLSSAKSHYLSDARMSYKDASFYLFRVVPEKARTAFVECVQSKNGGLAAELSYTDHSLLSLTVHWDPPAAVAGEALEAPSFFGLLGGDFEIEAHGGVGLADGTRAPDKVAANGEATFSVSRDRTKSGQIIVHGGNQSVELQIPKDPRVMECEGPEWYRTKKLVPLTIGAHVSGEGDRIVSTVREDPDGGRWIASNAWAAPSGIMNGIESLGIWFDNEKWTDEVPDVRIDMLCHVNSWGWVSDAPIPANPNHQEPVRVSPENGAWCIDQNHNRYVQAVRLSLEGSDADRFDLKFSCKVGFGGQIVEGPQSSGSECGTTGQETPLSGLSVSLESKGNCPPKIVW